MSMNTCARLEIVKVSAYFNKVEEMLLEKQERIEALEAESTKAGQSVVKPIPCRKFKDASALEWVAKLNEEVHEVIEETTYLENLTANYYTEVDVEEVGVTKKRLAEELTDVITVCVSWLDTLGYDEAVREKLQAQVNEKNRKRGYHDE